MNDIGIMTIKGQKIINCHLSMRTWYKASEGSWMFYGHSHGSLPPYGKKLQGNKEKDLFKTMDVGIDTHPEFRPYHVEELRELMNKRSNLVLDHHK